MNESILDIALEKQLITLKQRRQLADELAREPGQDAEALLLSRHYVTPAQLQTLKGGMLAGDYQEDSRRSAAKAPALQTTTAPATQETPPPSPPASGEFALPSSPTGQPRTLKDLLRLARHWGCSDLHLSVGRPPFVRFNGQLRYMESKPLTAEAAEAMNFSALSEEQRERALRSLNLDFALDLPGIGRHRCNVLRQRLGWDGVYRIIPNKIPTLAELGMPPVVEQLTDYHQGLVLVTGPARSGKTSTLAAMVDRVNRSFDSHIITIEDPLEYIHQPVRCQVTQREIGAHSQDFGTALRAALREDPDIIMVGEMRDLETISIAISAAETGHLVLGTLHTGSATRTVARILDVYPPGQREQIAVMVSESMRGVVSQQLIPRKDSNGLALALEILVVTSGVSALIKESKTHQLSSVIQAGRRHGMQLMDDSLLELMRSGAIAGAEAYRLAENKAPFDAHKDTW